MSTPATTSPNPSDALLLVADIGGTHNRWQLVRATATGWVAVATTIARNDESPSFTQAWQRAVAALAPPGPLAQVVIAAAGPVANSHITLTNRPTWRIAAGELAAALGAPVALLNDFAAQAYGLLTVTPPECERLAPLDGETPPIPRPGTRPLAVIGPGTGLGVAFLWQPDPHHPPLVLATEAGNLRLPLLPEITPLWEAIAHDAPLNQPYWEWLLSGPGLARLYRLVHSTADRNGGSAPPPTPEAIVATALADPSSTAAATVTLFARLLAHFASEATLMTWATEGVVLVGSLANAIAPVLRAHEWRDAFAAAPRYRETLAGTPRWLIHASDLGLRGAAWYGHASIKARMWAPAARASELST